MRESTEFVEAAAALKPVLAREQAAGDRDRRLTGEAMAAMRDAGMFRMFVPESLGGSELGLRTSVDALAELAYGDPSASWVVMILGAADLVVAQMAFEAQQEIYADGPDTHVCVVLTPHATAERVDGGWRMSGEWFPASGCLHSSWGVFGFPIEEGDAGVAAIPFSELRIKDTWHTVGMRATGSNLVVGRDVFVPDHRVLRLRDAIAGPLGSGARFRSALLPTVLTYMIGPYLGMAEAALGHVMSKADKRPVSFTTYQRQSDSPAFQIAIAEASAKIDVARLLAHSCASVIDDHALADTFPDYATRARHRLHVTHAVRQCGEALEMLVAAHGAAAVAESSPLSVLLRDMQTGLKHAMINPSWNLEACGRALLGVEPNITPLL
ncbi:acyl-CoA dehydrogenase [Lentzea aerocolonigenes]|uniref:Acyl-CoA dehydrogenase n=1 Tax=Lentzea aerocolonigenes TaxID=68170 RepID=A0A0F0GRE0_LENAE|nr:acyl-CoA dehydrogenase family protein [Lentzea aerocolonigenes]KJK45161.1 acyl-CoA dehydrogenase [Lentzea aerocolonigenes]